jgi:hypothetical protein
MVYEMYNYSQYEDGSVLNCVGMETFTAQEVADFPEGRGWTPLLKTIWRDMRRIAKAALKNGTTLREEAVKGGYVTEAEFDEIVRPEKMIGPS